MNTENIKKDTPRLILASASPRRRQLLGELGVRFEVRVPETDEASVKKTTPYRTVRDIALLKARATAAESKGGELILASDTVVVLDECLLGKPTSRDDSKATLRALSGRSHEVMTAIALIRTRGGGGYAPEDEAAAVETTAVYFRELDDGDIEQYVQSGECDDKAGSYGIQGLGGLFVEKIEGDHRNVVGLPIFRLEMLMKERFGLSLTDYII